MTDAARQEGPRGVRWWEIGLLLSVLCLAGLWRFEERGVLYFDELINAGMAKDGEILDFSLRPLYRVLNLVAWHLFGSDYESLRLLGFLSYAATALVVFHVADRLSGRAVAWAAFLAVAVSETVLVHGIRGMPHMPAGLLLTLALFQLVESLDASVAPRTGSRWHAAAAGLLAMMAVAVHPTVLPFALALGIWAVTRLAVRRVRTRQWRGLVADPAIALILTLAVGSLALYGVMLLDGRSYVAAIFGGVETVQGEANYSFYHRPWHQYLTSLVSDVAPFVLLVVGAMAATVARIRAKGREQGSVPHVSSLGALIWITACSFIVLSLLSWRFERVLVTYVPLVVLLAAACLAYALAASKGTVRRWARGGLIAVLVTTAAISFVRTTSALESIAAEDWKRFDRFSEVLSSVAEGSGIGYLGDGGRYERARDFVRGSGLDLTRLASGFERPAEDLGRELIDRGLFFVLTDLPDPGDRRGQADWWNQALSTFELEEIYEHRDFFRLWRLRPKGPSVELREALTEIEPKTQVAVLGWPEELESLRDSWIESLLERQQLRPYRLSLAKRAEVQFNFIPSKGIRYVWLTPGGARVEENNLEEFRQLIVDAGGRLLAEDKNAQVELWEIPP